jgi:hypothetical protein
MCERKLRCVANCAAKSSSDLNLLLNSCCSDGLNKRNFGVSTYAARDASALAKIGESVRRQAKSSHRFVRENF